MTARIHTMCHADRVQHAFFGDVDLLQVIRDPGALPEGRVAWVLRPDGTRVRIRVKGLWQDEEFSDPHSVVVVIEPLPFHPAELEGCALEWREPPPAP